jgi:hypothetical protein
MLRWDRYGFDKRHVGTCCLKIVFLHPVASTGHVVHSDAPAAQNVDTLFSMLGWDRYKFHKKHTVTLYVKLVFLHPVEPAGHVVHSGAFGA